MNVSSVLPANWRDVFSPNHRRIGIGVDPATTTKAKSNPSSIAVIQQVGLMHYARVLIRFKTSDPRVTTALIRELTDLPHGLKVRRICILATNERFYAAAVKREFSGKVPVELTIESEGCIYLGEKMSFKVYLGNQLVNTMEDGYLAVPDYPWVKGDIRQVVREGGTFGADVDEAGNHADGFCALGAGLHALSGRGGPAKADAVQVGALGRGRSGMDLKNPYAAKFGNPTSLNV